jgi:2-oxoglutarate dehydrogenase complex dehydrogenase (E1) component-like enzyme
MYKVNVVGAASHQAEACLYVLMVTAAAAAASGQTGVVRVGPERRQVTVSIAPNPSHLEVRPRGNSSCLKVAEHCQCKTSQQIKHSQLYWGPRAAAAAGSSTAARNSKIHSTL